MIGKPSFRLLSHERYIQNPVNALKYKRYQQSCWSQFISRKTLLVPFKRQLSVNCYVVQYDGIILNCFTDWHGKHWASCHRQKRCWALQNFWTSCVRCSHHMLRLTRETWPRKIVWCELTLFYLSLMSLAYWVVT